MLSSIIGGVLIGISASLYWSLNGRVAGVSGILSGAFLERGAERWVRFAFLLGLLSAGVLFAALTSRIALPTLPLLPLVFAGLLVGVGTQLGNGCTSGHGVCGLSRFSTRSLVAVLTFMTTGAFTVFIVRHVLKWWVPS
jgi:hypothetical protein